jgi:hypothetical protein
MKAYYKSIMSIFLGIIVVAVLFTFLKSADPGIEMYTELNHLPKIDPDYNEIIIPPNIAPLNFIINEKGTEYYTDIHVKNSSSNPIKILTKTNKVIIPIKKWKNILSSNRGKELYIDIYLKNQFGEWKKFRSLENKIAKEEIDVGNGNLSTRS